LHHNLISHIYNDAFSPSYCPNKIILFTNLNHHPHPQPKRGVNIPTLPSHAIPRFAICYRPSVCVCLSVVRRFKFSAIFLRH